MNRNGLAAVLIMLAVSVAGAQERTADFDRGGDAAYGLMDPLGNGGGLPVPMPFPMPSGDPAPGFGWHPMEGCALFCEYGYKDNCTCANSPAWTDYPPMPDPYFCQELGTPNWYSVGQCPGMQDNMPQLLSAQKSARSGLSPAGLQRKLHEVLLGYCDTYPEFAASVLPMLKAPGSVVFYRDGFVNISAGDKLMRFGGGLSRWAVAEQAAQAVSLAGGAV